jgi:hypothetical protein
VGERAFVFAGPAVSAEVAALVAASVEGVAVAG